MQKSGFLVTRLTIAILNVKTELFTNKLIRSNLANKVNTSDCNDDHDKPDTYSSHMKMLI